MWPGASPNSTVIGAAGLTIGAIVIGGLFFARDLLMPLALASLLSFVLSPLVKKLVRKRVPRGLAVTLVMALLLTLIIVSIGLLGRQAASLAESLPTYQDNLSRKVQLAKDFLGSGGMWKQAFSVLQDLQNQLSRKRVRLRPLRSSKPHRSPLDRPSAI